MMNALTWKEKAALIAKEVYRVFLDDVVERHVLEDREDIPLGQETKRKLEKHHIAHPNVVRLLTISGKGGYYDGNGGGENPYSLFYNITLLDHLLSVVRGALVFAAYVWLNQNPDMDVVLLKRRLRVIAVIAFLHDLDKDLQLKRNTGISEDMIHEAMIRYGLYGFLSAVGVRLELDQVRYLIEKTEASQAHRNQPKNLPPREFESLPMFVRLADQLDGIWCLDDPVKGGLLGVLERIRTDESVLRSGFLKSWKAIRLFDPHHSFLLDELQDRLSRASLRAAGIPPLIETHRDGELFMLLPGEHAESVIEKAVKQLCESLPFKLDVEVSTRGVPSMFNDKPSHKRLATFISQDLPSKKLSQLFLIKESLKQEVMSPLDQLLSTYGIAPRWPKTSSGALVSLYSSFEEIEGTSRRLLGEIAHLVLLLNLKVDGAGKSEIPGYSSRENALLDLAGKERPAWISQIGIELETPDQSRRTLTAIWVATLAAENQDLWDAVWGEEGLLKRWIEGDNGKPGMRDFITGRGAKVALGLERRLIQLLSNQRVEPEAVKVGGHCLFTGEPVRFDEPIKEADGLYGVKVSAFSGRDGRPEVITSESAHTLVSATSIAEHKLRQKVHEGLGGPDNGVPALISSPATSGLFGGLALQEDKAMRAISINDMDCIDVKKGRIILETEIHRSRFRMARLERMPEKLTDQVILLGKLLRGCRRIGRPLHIFRGLPLPERSFFFYDSMPRVLVDLLGTNSFRLEQIPTALKRLEMAQALLKAHGLGYEAFRRYANHSTRFGAICLSCCNLWGNKKRPGDIFANLVTEYRKAEGENKMSEQDGAIVRFGKAAASIQKRPSRDPSASEELLVFKVAMDAVSSARRIGQMDEASLVCAVAGELETNLTRRDKTWVNNPGILRKSCLDVAELFVKDVWLGVLKGKIPGQSDRRVMASIYRMAFLMENRKQD